MHGEILCVWHEQRGCKVRYFNSDGSLVQAFHPSHQLDPNGHAVWGVHLASHVLRPATVRTLERLGGGCAEGVSNPIPHLSSDATPFAHGMEKLMVVV
jgi:hypothetical protein